VVCDYISSNADGQTAEKNTGRQYGLQSVPGDHKNVSEGRPNFFQTGCDGAVSTERLLCAGACLSRRAGKLQPAYETKLISVLVPTTPNPTSGFLLMVDQDDLIYLDMKPEDAIKYIISVGVITPEIRRGKK
jgi:hypothetical protein